MKARIDGRFLGVSHNKNVPASGKYGERGIYTEARSRL